MRFLLSPCCYNTVLLASVRRWAGGSCGAAFGVNYLRSSLCIQAAAVLTAPVPGLSATWRMGGAKPAPGSLHPEPAWGKGLKHSIASPWAPHPYFPGTTTELPVCLGHRRGSTLAQAGDHCAFSSPMCTHQSHLICQAIGRKGKESFISCFYHLVGILLGGS